MKKRAKLFTTIASLCLAVALMAFGVYAATSATFTVTGSVSFTASNDVYVRYVGTSVYYGSTLGTAATIDEGYELTPTLTETEDWTTENADGSAKTTTQLEAGSVTGIPYKFVTAAQATGAEAVAGEGVAVYNYKVVVEFEATNSMTDLTIDLANTLATPVDANVTYTAIVSKTTATPADIKGVEQATVTEGDKFYVIIDVQLVNPAVEATESAYSTAITFTVDKVVAGD